MQKVLVMSLALCALLGAVEQGKLYKFKDGTEAYEKVCAHCHTLKIAPHTIFESFSDPATIAARRDSIVYTVRHGLNAMPAFRKSEISDATLKELATRLADGTIKLKER